MNLANETRGHAADAIWEGAAPYHATTPDQTAGVRLCSPAFPDLPIRPGITNRAPRVSRPTATITCSL
jgi:hypothetical protein